LHFIFSTELTLIRDQVLIHVSAYACISTLVHTHVGAYDTTQEVTWIVENKRFCEWTFGPDRLE